MKEGDLIRVSDKADTPWGKAEEGIYLMTTKDGGIICCSEIDNGVIDRWKHIIQKPEPETEPYNQQTFPEGRSVKHDTWSCYHPITRFGPDNVKIGGNIFSYLDLYHCFTFRDGSRCRRVINEEVE